MVEIRNMTKARVPAALVKKIAEKVLAKEKTKKKEVSVVFVSPKTAKMLNTLYRGKTYAPNVLSFPVEELGLGEVVLCPAVIRKDAEKYGITFKAELTRIFIHGLLHLVGYGHAKDADFKKMVRKEEQYLSLVS